MPKLEYIGILKEQIDEKDMDKVAASMTKELSKIQNFHGVVVTPIWTCVFKVQFPSLPSHLSEEFVATEVFGCLRQALDNCELDADMAACGADW